MSQPRIIQAAPYAYLPLPLVRAVTLRDNLTGERHVVNFPSGIYFRTDGHMTVKSGRSTRETVRLSDGQVEQYHY